MGSGLRASTRKILDQGRGGPVFTGFGGNMSHLI